MVDFIRFRDPVPYTDALWHMEAMVKKIAEGQAPEQIWLLEHPPLYTQGPRGKETDILDRTLPVYQTGRGGQVTYHGPGQRILYVMLNLNERGRDLRAYIATLEHWMIGTLQALGIHAMQRPGRVGLWIPRSATQDDKIAAIGVRIQKWVTSHGVALNVFPDLKAYAGIIPCGITDHGITSLAHLGIPASLHQVDELLLQHFPAIWGGLEAMARGIQEGDTALLRGRLASPPSL